MIPAADDDGRRDPGGRDAGETAPQQEHGTTSDGAGDGGRGLTLDRHLVLEQLGGWRGMVDATLPTVAFIVANSIGGLRTGIWAAIGAAVLVLLFRLVRRESPQQAFSGLFGVAVAVAIAAASGQARNYYVPGIIRNAVIGVVLLGSVPLRWPLVGVLAEFLAPSHLGSMAAHTVPGLRRRVDSARARLHHQPPPDPVQAAPGERPADPEPERHWRDDPRVVRAYGWLTVVWALTFLLRVAVQTPLYLADEDDLLGVASLVLGLPVTAAALALTLWVVSRLHRHRVATEADGE
ncbi:uncharacterized protein DUF3159 [Geodermatophilus normandii]|uniref:Uncharacterized protein DUF3159 n=1 Tax=Geodermatophilus normandii TaxID=1137989 RepID=A0A317QPR1_9ACTN|nr:DUF3159 domain-containing protein [Geodermatophilus normandii]PWW23630.1 uncharacterized protein DUF3159 [Geodermatophilus normandii]